MGREALRLWRSSIGWASLGGGKTALCRHVACGAVQFNAPRLTPAPSTDSEVEGDDRAPWKAVLRGGRHHIAHRRTEQLSISAVHECPCGNYMLQDTPALRPVLGLWGSHRQNRQSDVGRARDIERQGPVPRSQAGGHGGRDPSAGHTTRTNWTWSPK